MSALPVQAIAPATTSDALVGPTSAFRASKTSFSAMLSNGLNQVNQQLINADKLATAFALDESIPVHQVTFALAQARMSAEMMLQVRSELLNGYQELLRMQL